MIDGGYIYLGVKFQTHLPIYVKGLIKVGYLTQKNQSENIKIEKIQESAKLLSKIKMRLNST